MAACLSFSLFNSRKPLLPNRIVSVPKTYRISNSPHVPSISVFGSACIGPDKKICPFKIAPILSSKLCAVKRLPRYNHQLPSLQAEQPSLSPRLCADKNKNRHISLSRNSEIAKPSAVGKCLYPCTAISGCTRSEYLPRLCIQTAEDIFR